MLSVEHVSKRFGDVVALRDVSFTVAPGRILGFLGRNGAGKTTTMRCVFGLVRPDAGLVTYGGSAVDEQTRLRFGYMPEERGLYPKMRVKDQLVHLGRLSGLSTAVASDEAMRWLDRFGLRDRASSNLEELSHGNQQRIQLVAALLHRPELLVLDEPFAGLDPIGVESLSEVLLEFAAEGAAILFSSHQLDLVEDICEDVAIIDEGAVVVDGDLATLRDDATYRRVEIHVDGVLWEPHVGAAHRVDSAGRTHHIVEASVGVDQLLTLARADGEITRFAYESPSLSDIFHEAVVR